LERKTIRGKIKGKSGGCVLVGMINYSWEGHFVKKDNIDYRYRELGEQVLGKTIY